MLMDGKSQTTIMTHSSSLTDPVTFSAIGLDATNPVFYCNRAAAFSRIGEYQKAVDDCNQAIRYDPNYGKGKWNIRDIDGTNNLTQNSH
jgi:tetratricopeptide (TPR) repeat protein